MVAAFFVFDLAYDILLIDPKVLNLYCMVHGARSNLFIKLDKLAFGFLFSLPSMMSLGHPFF